MIRIEDIDEIPEGEWNDLSGKEFMRMNPVARNLFLRFSYPRKAIYKNNELICVAGLFRESLTNPPFLWALISKSFDRAAARAIRNIDIPPCITYIEAENRRAARLGRWFGFHLVEGNVLMGDTMYDVYRRS